MTKLIKVILENDNSIKITCEEKTHKIMDNSITSLDIYDLLNYNFGDKYVVNLEEIGNKTEIVRPIKEMFDKIVEEIEKLQLPEELIKDDIQQLSSDQASNLFENTEAIEADLPF